MQVLRPVVFPALHNQKILERFYINQGFYVRMQTMYCTRYRSSDMVGNLISTYSADRMQILQKASLHFTFTMQNIHVKDLVDLMRMNKLS